MREMHKNQPWRAIIANCFALMRGNFAGNLPMWSGGLSEVVQSRDMFAVTRNGVVYCLPKHLPVGPDLKFIRMLKNSKNEPRLLAIEITELDFPKLEARLQEMNTGLRLSGKRIFYQDVLLLQTVTQHHFRVAHREVERSRTLVKTAGPIADANSEAIGDFFDAIFGYNLCKQESRIRLEDPADQAEYDTAMQNTSRAPMGMRMEQIMSQRLQMKMEQCYQFDMVPMFKLSMVNAFQLAQRAERSKILQMSGDQLREHASNAKQGNIAFE